ncbi:MAG: 2-phospho-L-lactate guanylyltransferase [Nocardioides sp.]|uniref:2-phospho-L-lactate guanylyltransferase n=1 Tax=Nocardioides sp. TaxID=35761 RepID=UPI003F0863EC
MSENSVAPACVVLLPVKPPGRGKSRLVGLPDHERATLAAAFALDTASAALDCPAVDAVLAVTDDHHFARRLLGLGCAVIPDGVTNDLNGSLRQAALEAARRWPGARPVALTADLPCLTPEDLATALSALTGSAAFVRDAAGTGTTLYSAPTSQFRPRFGQDSAQAHASAGAREVGTDLASLRRDVDTVADLGVAMVLGLGPHTAAASGRAV